VPVSEIALGLSVVALALGCVSLVFHWARRASHPLLEPVERRIDELRLAHADVVDRLEAFMNRERVRRSREAKLASQDEPGASIPSLAIQPPGPVDTHAELRIRARTQGHRV
jgi:hypothetical protein